MNTSEITSAAQLVKQAQAAYEQKRTKESASLVKDALRSDPENAEARAIQAAILSDISRDLTDARALLNDAQRGDGGHKYRKAAEIILLKILYVDPDHAEAKSMLATAKGSAESQPAARATTAAVHAAPAPAAVETKHTQGEELMFTAAPVPFQKKPEKRSAWGGKLPLVVVGALFVVVGGVLFFGFFSKHPATTASVSTPPPAPTPTPAVRPASQPPSKPAVTPAKVTPSSTPTPAVPAETRTAATPTPAAVPTPAVPATGFLAVSSPTSAEIYMNDKRLGETPTTLQLNAGKQTLEYRHGNLKTVITHDIKAKETTTAFVTFDVDVQINARPWAQVFLEGSTRKALGQTPLGSVRVPIGSTLTFENPNFPTKSYRVTDKDSSIQIAFP